MNKTRGSLEKKKFTCGHRDLQLLLSGLQKSGVFINAGEMDNEVYILANHGPAWVEAPDKDIIFGAKPVGRKNDEIWYECIYTDAFDASMNTLIH